MRETPEESLVMWDQIRGWLVISVSEANGFETKKSAQPVREMD